MTDTKPDNQREIVPRDLRDLLRALDDLADPAKPAVCRGQANAAYNLVPSLDRHASPDESYGRRIDEERCLIEQFRRRAEHLLGEHELRYLRDAAPSDLILPLTVMQHFGAPTRLLDWTESPSAAAFFAAVSRLDIDGAVWWYRVEPFNAAARVQQDRLGMPRDQRGEIQPNDHIFKEDSPEEFICPIYLRLRFSRAAAQQGLFTVAGRLGMRHDNLLSYLLPSAEHFGKLRIPWQLKRDLLHALRARCVTATSLQHVGADQLGWDMNEERRRKNGHPARTSGDRESPAAGRAD